jgi:hypothetical protein
LAVEVWCLEEATAAAAGGRRTAEMAPKKNVNEKVEAARYAMTRIFFVNFAVLCMQLMLAYAESAAAAVKHK